MGDRTWVTLTVFDEDVETVTDIISDEPEDDWESDGTLSTCQFDEANYGDLPEEAALQDAGIPYDKAWGRGDEYGSGIQYCRYTDDGELALLDVYDDACDPELGELLKRIDEPDKLRSFILEHKASITPLSWDTQQTNRKRFRTRQLIAA